MRMIYEIKETLTVQTQSIPFSYFEPMQSNNFKPNSTSRNILWKIHPKFPVNTYWKVTRHFPYANAKKIQIKHRENQHHHRLLHFRTGFDFCRLVVKLNRRPLGSSLWASTASFSETARINNRWLFLGMYPRVAFQQVVVRFSPVGTTSRSLRPVSDYADLFWDAGDNG